MTSDGPFYNAKHSPNEIRWRPVTRRKILNTSRGPVPVRPGIDVEIEENGDTWVNTAIDFARRYGSSLIGKARAIFEEHYPGVLE